MSKSYKDVLNKTYPAYNDNIDNLLYGGTDHDINGNDSVTSLSYGLNEDISFIFHLKGDYVLKWNIDKDNAAYNVYGDEIANGNVVASGEHNPATDGYVFKYTTRMKQAGIVRFKGRVVNSDTGDIVKTFYVSAAADYANITQSLENSFAFEDLIAETVDFYTKWKGDEHTGWNGQVAKVKNAIINTNITNWINDTKFVDDEYIIEGILKLKVAEVTDKYTSFYFWIATGDKGIDTSATENERPATGVFSVPNGTGFDMFAQFLAWDPSPMFATGAPGSMLNVRVLNHGKENGAKMDLNPNNNTGDPTKVFAYGVLKRDYIAVQVARVLFADKLNDKLTISTYGASAGGWQAISMAALDEDVNNVTTRITWLCSLGAEAAGDIASGFHPVDCAGTRVFSTVTAARIINARVAANGKAFTFNISDAGLGDYQASAPHGVVALYNAFTDEKVIKSATFTQFREHGALVYGSSTNFVSALTNKQ